MYKLDLRVAAVKST